MCIETVCHIGMHPWWQLARHKPNLTNLASGVLAVLQGGQPHNAILIAKHANCAERQCPACIVCLSWTGHCSLSCMVQRTTINAWSSSGGTSQLQYKDNIWNHSIGLKVSIHERMDWNTCKCRQIYSWYILPEEKLIRWHWTISFGHHRNELWKRGFASSHHVYTACIVGKYIILFVLRVIP